MKKEDREKNSVTSRRSQNDFAVERVIQELENINNRVKNLERFAEDCDMSSMRFISPELFLPDHQLIDTYIVIASEGKCDASQVARITGRSRSTESNYLNQLYRAGWLDKIKLSKTTYFVPL